jgi:hypothetical protein
MLPGLFVDGIEQKVRIEQHQRLAGPSTVSIASQTLE